MDKKGNFQGTTVIAVRKDGITAVAADGQVSMGGTVIKKGLGRYGKYTMIELSSGLRARLLTL